MAHLSTEELIRWRDEGIAEDRDRLLGHVATCAECRATYAQMIRTSEPEPAAGSPFDARDFVDRGYQVFKTHRRSVWLPAGWRPLSLAAAALLVVAVAVVYYREGGGPPVERGQGGTLALVRPVDATVGADELTFEWRAPAGAARFRLQVFDVSRPAAPLIQRDLSMTRYSPAPDERRRFQPGVRYHWFVEWRGDDGVIETSAAASFTLH